MALENIAITLNLKMGEGAKEWAIISSFLADLLKWRCLKTISPAP